MSEERGPDVPGLGRDYRETNERLEAMADELQITLKRLIEAAERSGVEIVATRPEPAKHPGHC